MCAVNYRKSVGKHFLTEESNSKVKSESVIILNSIFIFRSTTLQLAGLFIWTTWIWIVAIYTADPQNNLLTPQAAISGFLPEYYIR